MNDKLNKQLWYEAEIMLHRYLYYVLAEPVISDMEYDMLEREARAFCPADSVVQGVGSSLPNSYSKEIIRAARARLNN